MSTSRTQNTLTLTFSFALATVASTTLHIPNALSAGRGALRPEQRERMKQQVQEYNNCRSDVLANVKSGRLPIERSRVELDGCRKRFSGASLYSDCKAKVLKTKANKDAETIRKAIIQCQDYLVAGNFNPDDPFPFKLELGGKISFAGIEFNDSSVVTDLKPINFDCGNVRLVVNSPDKARYSFFGNQPRLFANLGDIKNKADLFRVLGLKRIPANGKARVPGFGEINGDPALKQSVVYFPTAQCDYERAVGRVYTGLQIHYLMDFAQKEAIPYMAVAYYEPKLQTIATTDIERKMLGTMGPGSIVTAKKGDQTRFIASGQLTEFDAEGDPMHLCKKPRKHAFLGVIRSSQGPTHAPNYLMLANIKNLCDYGDRLAARLAAP